MYISRNFLGCALGLTLVSSAPQIAPLEKRESLNSEASTVSYMCTRQNPLVMVLNTKNGLFSVYRCDAENPKHFDRVLVSRALWGQTTKTGIYDEVSLGAPVNAKDYPGGVALMFNGAQAVHGVYIPESRERNRSLQTLTLADNLKSKGCINLPDPVFENMIDYYKKLFSTGHITKYPSMTIL